MFSSRLPPLAPNAFSRALARARKAGRPLLDLTESNPTAVGLPYPDDLRHALADPGVMTYAPDPRGARPAREAVAAEYARRGIAADPDAIVLTASTSEAYSVLFKLFCDPGDAVLVPQPSYPLFELLGRLDGVRPQPYRLSYHGVWTIDRSSFQDALTADARAILLVSPNNPTGSVLQVEDREWLVELAAARRLPLVVDEVFTDYPLAPQAGACTIAGDSRAVTFALGGLSKSAGLPQVKLGWMFVSGPTGDVRSALERLDIICDTYLSVSASAQVAAPRLLAAGRAVRGAIMERLAGNLAALRSAVARWPAVTLLEPEAGWSAVLRVPAVQSEETLVLRALDEAGVVVHPGFFFDFAEEAYVVASLLPEPVRFRGGIERLLPLAAGSA
jgi:aspartate/methionine/tyrosine aminotransferase